MIKSNYEAIKAVNTVKYLPMGKRRVSLVRAQNYGFGLEAYAKDINYRTKVIAQIEHI